jgi:enoyl-CoA hydratase/carnithine racemase
MLDIDRRDGVTTLLIDRPERKNAFDRALTLLLAETLERETHEDGCPH